MMEELARVVAQDEALEALERVLGNLVREPRAEKYRVLRTDNAAVASKLLASKAAVRVLNEVGFVQVDGYLALSGVVDARCAEALAAVKRARSARERTEDTVSSVGWSVVDQQDDAGSSYALSRPSSSACSTPSSRASSVQFGAARVGINSPTARDVASGRTNPQSALPRGTSCVRPDGDWTALRGVSSEAKRELKGMKLVRSALLYGPGGCGKKKLALCAAANFGRGAAVVIEATDLRCAVSKQASEFRRFYSRARSLAPCALIVADADSALDAIDPDLLDRDDGVFVVVTSNDVNGLVALAGSRTTTTRRRVSKIDPSSAAERVLDRFDRLLFVGPPSRADRLDFLSDPAFQPHDLDLLDVAHQTDGFTLRALRGLISAARARSKRLGQRLDETHLDAEFRDTPCLATLTATYNAQLGGGGILCDWHPRVGLVWLSHDGLPLFDDDLSSLALSSSSSSSSRHHQQDDSASTGAASFSSSTS